MNFKYCIASLSVALTMSSCGNFLEEYSQDHDYVRTWTDLNELLIGDCYTPVSYSNDYYTYSNKGMFLHLFSDEVEEQNGHLGNTVMGYNSHSYMFGCLTWQRRVGINETGTSYRSENATWTQMYKYINVANNVLASVEDVPQQQDAELAGVNYVKGQAHFLRAFYYFWLTNVYGQPYNPSTASSDLGVPLKTSKEVEDIIFSRNSVEECYNLILDDLLKAEKEMSLAKSIRRRSLYRADSVSVQLLLSRVYLYMQNWEKAAEYARKVIDVHPALQDLNDDASYFASLDNPETIFTMGGDDLPNSMQYAGQSLRVSNQLYNAYKENDLRKSQWFWKYASFQGITKAKEYDQYNTCGKDNPSYYYMRYLENKSQRPVSSLFWLRSGEAYLNLAEAEAYMGHEDRAREAVSTLRKSRFQKSAPDAELTSTGSQLITDIRNERKLDLVCEGHRWFDLRRYRVCSVQPEKISITHNFTLYVEETDDAVIETRQFVLTEDDPSWTAPIPNEVLEYNVGMPNNGNIDRTYTVVETEE